MHGRVWVVVCASGGTGDDISELSERMNVHSMRLRAVQPVRHNFHCGAFVDGQSDIHHSTSVVIEPTTHHRLQGWSENDGIQRGVLQVESP